jgi:hypothetical protein
MFFSAVVCDLDGTLAMISPERGPYDADQCELDAVREPVAEVLRWARTNGRMIVLITGRGVKESHRTATKKWLYDNRIAYHQLMMREVGDNRADHVIKSEMADKMERDGVSIDFVMDDRQSVVDMWRERGHTVFQVDNRI